MAKNGFLTPALFSLLAFCGCSEIAETSSDNTIVPAVPNVSYQLYLSRRSLEGASFEQYRLLPVGLFVECGDLKSGREQGSEGSIVPISSATQEGTQRMASALLIRSARGDASANEQPGDNSSFADPGKVVLIVSDGVREQEIATSLDAVEARRGALPSALHAFARLVRGVPAEPPCGNDSFFGIARDSK
jgi:hypothetical protein